MRLREVIFMNTKEAAIKWNVQDRTVRGWCKDGWIASAKFDEKKRSWQMDSEALKPLKFSGRNQEKHIDRLALILTALSERKTIPPDKLHCDKNELLEHIEELISLQFVKKRKVENDDIFQCYTMTFKGDEFLASRKGLKKIADDLSPLIAAVTEGATKAILTRNQ